MGVIGSFQQCTLWTWYWVWLTKNGACSHRTSFQNSKVRMRVCQCPVAILFGGVEPAAMLPVDDNEEIWRRPAHFAVNSCPSRRHRLIPISNSKLLGFSCGSVSQSLMLISRSHCLQPNNAARLKCLINGPVRQLTISRPQIVYYPASFL